MERRDLKWFLGHLELVLQDLLIEDRGDSLEFYWDSVDVTAAVLGLDNFYDPSGRFDKRRFQDDAALIDCLAGAGWFGTIKLLPPHQAEFLKHMIAGFGTTDDGVFGSRVDKLIVDCGLKHFLPEASCLSQMPEDGIVTLIREQAENAPTLFKVVYCAAGLWKRRLASWMRTSRLEVDREIIDYAGIVNSDHCQALKKSLDFERPTLAINNLADAVAICLLAAKMEAYRAGLVRTMPRFFVSSPLYKMALEKTGLLDILQYSRDGEHISVLRDRDYYKFKAILQPSHAEQTFGHSPSSTLIRSLYGVRDQIRAILGAQIALRDDVLAEITLAGQPLTAVIESLKGFWFLENVWLPFGAAAQVRESVKEYVASARELKNSSQFSESIEREVKSAIETLTRHSQEYARLSRLWMMLDRAAVRFKQTAEIFETTHSMFQTCGLHRFGFPVDQHQDIESMLRRLIHDQDALRDVFVAIVCDLERRRDAVDFVPLVAYCAILWVLQLDEPLIALLGPTDQRRHYSLRILAAASRFRSKRLLLECQQITKSLEEEYEAATEARARLDLAVGLAYLYYQLYRCAKSEPSDTLEKAISFASNAYRDVGDADTRKTVYALNQFIYYSLQRSENLDWSTVSRAASELLAHMENDQVWHYQFDDTLATYFEKRAVTRDTDKGTKANWLRQAAYFMDRAWMQSPGDTQIEMHRASLMIKLEDS